MKKDKEIGIYIKKLREEKNMSQEELAKEINVTRHSISKWELGAHIGNKEHLENIAKVFNISPEYIEYAGKKKLYFIERIKKLFKKTYKKIFIICFILLLGLSVFLIICVTHNYNSIKFYSMSLANDNEYFWLDDGYFFISKEKVLLYLRPAYVEDENNINSIYLYYLNKDNGKKEYIYESTIKDKIKIMDLNGYEAYFKFDDLNNIMESLFFEIKFKDDSSSSIALNFTEVFANDYLFEKKYDSIVSDKVNKSSLLDSDLNEKIKKVSNKIMKLENNNSIELDYNNKHYKVSDLGEIFEVIYNDGKKEISLSYYNLDGEFFGKTISNLIAEPILVYDYSLTDNECTFTDGVKDNCESYEEDIALFNGVLDYILTL